jgi:uncharacterized protein YfaT (DUF1175 family)
MTNEEILREATLLRNASTDARELIELLARDLAAGQAAFRSATPEARGLVRRWLDPEFQLTERTRRLDPHWHAIVEKLQEKVRAGLLLD